MRVVAAALALSLSATVAAPAASCRGYGEEIRTAIKAPVEALRMVEREAADRLVGLDTRPYDHLVAQARAALASIADRLGLDQEDELKRCRNYIPPVRRTCAAAGEALVAVIAEQARGPISGASKGAYSTTITQCERFMELAPLKTALRTSE